MKSHSDDLDVRILAAEHQLIAREARLRKGWTSIGNEVRSATRARRLLAPAAGIGAALLALRLLLRPSASKSSREVPVPAPRLPFARLAAFIWPHLPERWRAKVPPTVIDGVLLFGPWLQALLQRRR